MIKKGGRPLEGEQKFFSFFKSLGYQKIEKIESKPKKEIVFVFITIGLVILRVILSLLGLNSGDIDAMKFSLYLNLIPVLQTILVLLRKSSELERKKAEEFNGVYRTTNDIKEVNPFLRRLFIMFVALGITVIAPILYLTRFSNDKTVAVFLLELVVWVYMIVSTVDGILEQIIVLFSVDV